VAFKDTFMPTQALVELHDASVIFGGRTVLGGISWRINPGEHWRISGSNGAGKTTLAKVLYGRVRAAHGGRVEFFGSSGRISVAELRRKVGLISDEEQSRYDWNIPVEEVVASGFFASVGLTQKPSDEQMQSARGLLADFGIADLASRRFLELSFGQRRLVLVARALVRIPQLLILDEALNGFDRDVRARVLRRIDSLAAAGTTFVMIGQLDSDIPEWVENDLQLENGRILSIRRRDKS